MVGARQVFIPCDHHRSPSTRGWVAATVQAAAGADRLLMCPRERGGGFRIASMFFAVIRPVFFADTPQLVAPDSRHPRRRVIPCALRLRGRGLPGGLSV